MANPVLDRRSPAGSHADVPVLDRQQTRSGLGRKSRATSQLFLVLGIPKSGTTFVQRMLDMHPEVSCPSEQSFDALAPAVADLLGKYESTLQVFDRRTGGQGVPAFDVDLRNNVLSAIITALAKSFAGSKPVHGLKENSIIRRVAYYERLLRRPKMIAVFRDPVDVAVSTWRHNHRLAEVEPDNADAHLAMLRNRAGTLDGYVTLFAQRYKTVASTYLAHAEGRPNFLTVRYEELVTDKKNQLRRIFNFLGADASGDTIRRIVAESSPQAMARTSNDPSFFGMGRPDGDGPRVGDQAMHQARRTLHGELARLGYDVGA